MHIENTQPCFVSLWQQLERTRCLFLGQYRRYCIRRICRSWFPGASADDLICEVCHLCGQQGYDLLPPPALNPYPHREFLRALVAVRLGLGVRAVNLKALDAAYSVAFPHSTPLNMAKKKKKRPPG